VTLLLAVVLAFVSVAPALAAPAFAATPANAAPAAPGFRVKLLDSPRTFDSREMMGKKVVVLRFQSSYCKPCVREAEALSRLVERYRGREVEFLALHVQDATADIRRFARDHRVNYALALDPKLMIGNRYGVKRTPYTVVIDRKGEIVARLPGESAVARLPRILDEALRRGGAKT
jgi:peroxiredoxin